MKKSLLIYPVLTLLAVSCGKQRPENAVIPEDVFVKVYADMLVVNGLEKMTKADTAHNRRMIDSLYESYHISRAQVRATIDYYNKRLELWKDILEKVDNRLQTLQATRTGKSGK